MKINIGGSRASLFDRSNRESMVPTKYAPLDNLKTGGSLSTVNLMLDNK